jgi:hypothetical protein
VITKTHDTSAFIAYNNNINNTHGGKMLKFKSKHQSLLVESGKLTDDRSRDFIKGALGLKTKKVEATRHTILSGPPGVGKTYGTRDECNKARNKYILIEPGITDITLTIKLACAVYSLKNNEELVVILDDADDVVFGDYQTLNKWKIAMADVDYDQGIIPTYNHPVSMTNTLASLQKQAEIDPSRQTIIDALKSFMAADSVGVQIPTDRVRFIVLCNLDLEDPKSFRSSKLRSAVVPVLDRMKYKRIELDWEKQWGWLSYTLGNTQPFEGHDLSKNQKVELLQWMYSNWESLRSTSYRTVKKLAEAMINEPDDYIDLWNEEKRGH